MSYLMGILVAAAVAGLAYVVGFDRSRNFYPLVLIVTASYYVLFAALSGSDTAMLAEALVIGAFTALAVIGFRRSLWIAIAGLLGHGVFDVFHGLLIDNPGVPAWWPAFCLAFDVAIAAYAALRLLSSTPFRECKMPCGNA